MKNLFGVLLVITVCFICQSCKNESVPNSPEEFIPVDKLSDSEKELLSELNKIITPFKGASISIDDTDLKVLDKFADAKVIGVGEATHGTREFFQMKHRLFKYFVEKHSFRIFGFEADMGECVYIDRFICKSIGTIDDAMNKMHFWTWKTQEVKELILWMNQYNKDKTDENKIHMVGVDCQLKDFNKPLIMEYLQKYDPNHPSFIDRILTDIDQLTNDQIKALGTDKRNFLKNRCDSIKTYFDNNSSKFIANSGSFDFEVTKRLVIQTIQFIDVLEHSNYNYRDLYMADNTEWLTKLLQPNTKVIQWAHNGHVAKDPYGSQGSYLQKKFGSQYKVIGFSFNTGEFRAVGYNDTHTSYTGLSTHSINQPPVHDSFNFIFNYSTPQNFILVNSDVPSNNSFNNWINTSHKFLMIGAAFSSIYFNDYFQPYNLSAAFDVIIHFHTSTASVPY